MRPMSRRNSLSVSATTGIWKRLDGYILAEVPVPCSDLPNAYEQLIGATDLAGLEGVAKLIDDIRENPSLRAALLLRTTTRLRDVLQAHNYEADVATPIQLDIQDAAVLLFTMLRRLS